MSLDGLRAYPLRTALSIFGVVIGVASLVATLAIGAGARESAAQGIRELGANLLFVRPGKVRIGYAWLGNVETLTLEDAEALGKIPGVAAAVPEVFSRVQIKYRNRNSDSRVFGVTPAYLDLLRYRLAAGSRFTEADVNGRWHCWGRRRPKPSSPRKIRWGNRSRSKGRISWCSAFWKREGSGWRSWRRTIGSWFR